MRRSIFVLSILLIALTVVPCFAQKQEYVGQYDAYVGYAYLTTPNMNLDERGFMAQFGYNYRRWVALGIDTSYFGGGSSVVPSQLNNATLAKLAPIFPLLPPGYNLYVPYHANTYTITGGPQFNYRGFKWVTLFFHPDIGAFYQSIQVHPQDPIVAGIAASLLGPSMKTSQWTGFYGVGGGIDINTSKHVGIRLTSDWIYTNLFTDLLRNPQYTWRMSASPTFRFGKNVPK